MNRQIFKHLIIGLTTLLVTITATAQNLYKLDEKNSSLVASGTSSLQDWEMKATAFSAETKLKVEYDSVSEIQYVEFTTPVSALESGKNLMENKAHNVLKEKKFPRIKFAMKSDKPIALPGNNATLNGMLTIAGKTKEIEVPVDFNNISDRQFTVSGKVSLKMSDFGIDPPTAFFGTLKTDDEVKVKYELRFNKSN